MDMSVQKFLKRREIAEASRKFARHFTTDGMMTYDQRTIDSTGAFLIGQLERLDQTLNMPLVEYTWSRDIEIRTDVSPADEVASFTNSAFAVAGNMTPGGLNWIRTKVMHLQVLRLTSARPARRCASGVRKSSTRCPNS
jgi:hypothetical protein